jgi:transposase
LIGLMKESELPEMKKIAKSLKRHINWILNYWIRKTTNAILEWINSQIQTIKRIARGFKNLDYFKSIIYIRLWRLNLSCINPLL